MSIIRTTCQGSKDLIIGCGALTQGVLSSREAALGVFNFLDEFTSPGTLVMLCGLEESYIYPDDFISKGYTLLNRKLQKYDFYIARKNGGIEPLESKASLSY